MKGPFIKLAKRGGYEIARPVSAEEITRMAMRLAKGRLRKGRSITHPDECLAYLKLTLAPLEHEVFCITFLDTRHRVIAFEEMFRGTIDGAMVHPREVVKRALFHNAAAVILVHNHPSGLAKQSQSDIRITERLKSILELIDVRILDHFIIGGDTHLSFAENGLL